MSAGHVDCHECNGTGHFSPTPNRADGWPCKVCLGSGRLVLEDTPGNRLGSNDAKTRILAIFDEWSKGCTNKYREGSHPSECPECTDGMAKAVANTLLRVDTANAQLEAVAAELDAVAAREDVALDELRELGVCMHDKSINFPSEQRDHAIAIRKAIEILS